METKRNEIDAFTLIIFTLRYKKNGGKTPIKTFSLKNVFLITFYLCLPKFESFISEHWPTKKKNPKTEHNSFCALLTWSLQWCPRLMGGSLLSCDSGNQISSWMNTQKPHTPLHQASEGVKEQGGLQRGGFHRPDLEVLYITSDLSVRIQLHSHLVYKGGNKSNCMTEKMPWIIRLL